MQLALTKKWLGVIVIALVLTFIVGTERSVLAATNPFFDANGGDVFAGGWFNNGAIACSNSEATYQGYQQATNTKALSGAIQAYASYNPATGISTGASSEFGALALGSIEYSTSSFFGFASNNGQGNNKLSFGNSNTITGYSYWGGFFEGSNKQTHCIPDYYSTKRSSSLTDTNNSATTVLSNISSLSSGQYSYIQPAGTWLDITGGSIPNNVKLTIFVKGDVLISSNITYAGGYDATTAPKFALVVLGSIYISSGASQLNGLYIAQPNNANNPATVADDTQGVFWTCHPNTPATAPTGSFMFNSCNNGLVINGAVIAKEIKMVRSNGNFSNPTPVAETFNYNPEMIINGPFFSQNSNTAKIESLINLPPVF